MRKMTISLAGGVLMILPIMYQIAIENGKPYLDWLAMIAMVGISWGLFAMLCTFAAGANKEKSN